MTKLMLATFATLVSIVPAAAEARQNAVAQRAADERQIHQLVMRELEGGTKQDIALTMSIYCKGPDTVLFESGPYIMKGYEKVKEAWEGYFKYFKKAEATISDLHVGASGDLGYAYALHNWKFTTHDGVTREDQHRVTQIYRRIGGKWCMIHENDSVPSKIVPLDDKTSAVAK